MVPVRLTEGGAELIPNRLAAAREDSDAASTVINLFTPRPRTNSDFSLRGGGRTGVFQSAGCLPSTERKTSNEPRHPTPVLQAGVRRGGQSSTKLGHTHRSQNPMHQDGVTTSPPS